MRVSVGEISEVRRVIRLSLGRVNATVDVNRGSNRSRSLLRCANFLLQNCAIQRNATRISLVLLNSEKHAAQRDENLRKNSLGNYKSAALPAELCRQKCAGK